MAPRDIKCESIATRWIMIIIIMHTQKTAFFQVASFTEPKNQHQDNYLTNAESRGAQLEKISIRLPSSGGTPDLVGTSDSKPSVVRTLLPHRIYRNLPKLASVRIFQVEVEVFSVLKLISSSNEDRTILKPVKWFEKKLCYPVTQF